MGVRMARHTHTHTHTLALFKMESSTASDEALTLVPWLCSGTSHTANERRHGNVHKCILGMLPGMQGIKSLDLK